MATIESQGTVFRVGDGGDPETFNAVGEVTGFDGPGGQANVIDTTNLASVRREKRMGIPDEGQITLNVNFDPSDTVGQGRLRTLRSTRAQGNFQVVYTDAGTTTWSFAGFVLGFAVSGAVDAVVTASITIEITGAVTES